MTTPADNTPYPIIVDAMQDAGLLQEGDDPSPEQLVKYMRRLRDLIRYQQTQGLKLFLLSDTPVTLVASQNKYTFMPSGDVNITKPMRVLDGYYLDSDSNRRPLSSMAWNDWMSLGNVSNEGAITQYFVDKKATELDVYFYLTPDTQAATGTAHVLLQQQATGPLTLNETTVFPEEWRIALHWGLAADICTGQPDQVVMKCEKEAMKYWTMLENWDVEDTETRFTPDPSSMPQRNFS